MRPSTHAAPRRRPGQFGALVLVSVLVHATVEAREERPAVEFDRWGVLAEGLTWTSRDQLEPWMQDQDWAAFPGYYTEDLLSGFGGKSARINGHPVLYALYIAPLATLSEVRREQARAP